jgi:ABC-type branched-subunit amino acid transport system substrate-binding protein
MQLLFGIGRWLRATRPVLGMILMAVLVSGCGGGGGGFPTAPSITGSAGAVKVALLLPIGAGGSTQNVAKALKQAAELALFDFDNPNIVLVPKDTQGTPGGARAAAESAIHDGAELILGPLFAQEVQAVAPVARQANVPVIAFSSDENVAGGGVYLLSFLAGRDVQRIVSFAASRGKRTFAELVPQSPYGRLAEAAFGKAVSADGGQIAINAPLPANDASGMIGPVRQVANAIRGGQSIDALFIPAGREALPSLASLLATNDLPSSRVQLLGTGQWDYPNIGAEKALIGGWYPAPDPKGWSNFTQRYAKTYGTAPPRLASLAYDAVSLAVSLSQGLPGQRYSPAQLTRPSGFAGVDGLFRLLPDGTCERGLAILEVREGGPVVIDPAPSSFATASSY